MRNLSISGYLFTSHVFFIPCANLAASTSVIPFWRQWFNHCDEPHAGIIHGVGSSHTNLVVKTNFNATTTSISLLWAVKMFYYKTGPKEVGNIADYLSISAMQMMMYTLMLLNNISAHLAFSLLQVVKGKVQVLFIVLTCGEGSRWGMEPSSRVLSRVSPRIWVRCWAMTVCCSTPQWFSMERMTGKFDAYREEAKD